MEQSPELKIRISADGKAAQTGISEVNAQLSQMAQKAQGASGAFRPLDPAADALSRIAKEAGSAGHAFEKFSTTAASSSATIAAKATDASTGISRMAGSAALFAGAAGSIMLAARAIDEYTVAASRINLVSSSLQSSAAAQASLFSIAQESRVEYAALAETYARLARSGNELGISQNRMLAVTRSISQAMTISGGSAESMKAALVQLSQGFSAGVLRGEELNSVLEQAPRLAQAIADGMGKSVGDLRKLGEEGKLTAQTVFGALEKTAPALAAEFAKMTPTIGQAFTVMKDGAAKAFYEFDKGSGSSAALASAMNNLGKSLGDAGSAAREFGEKYGTALKAVGEVAGILAAIAVVSKLTVALRALALFAASPIVIGVSIAVAGAEAMNHAIHETESGLQRQLEAAEKRLAAGNAGLAANAKASTATQEVMRAGIRSDEQAITSISNKLRTLRAEAAANTPTARASAAMRQSERDWEAEEQKAAQAQIAGRKKAFEAYMGEVRGEKSKQIVAEKDRWAALTAVIGTSGAQYDEALKAHQAKVAEINKKGSGGASGAKNDEEQIQRARLEEIRDAARLEIDLIKKRVAERVSTEEDGIEQIRELQIKAAQDEIALLAKRYEKSGDAGQRALLLADMQKISSAATQAVAEAEAGLSKLADVALRSHQDWMKGVGDETSALITKAETAELENAQIGLSADKLAVLTQQRYDEKIAILETRAASLEGIAGREAELYLVEQQIDALRRLQSAEVARPALKAQADEWKKFGDDIERSLTDSLYRAFESGDSFGKAFAKSLENTIKTMVLKFAVQMVVSTGGSVAASVADSVLGTSFSKSGGGSSGSSLLSGASNLSTAYSWGSTAADLAFGSSSGSVIPWLTGASAVAPSSVIAANAAGAVGGDAIGTLIAAEGWSTATAAGASAAAVGAEAGAAAAAAGAEGAAAGAATAAAAEGAGAYAAAAIPYVGWVIAAVAAIAALGGSGPKEYTGPTALSGAYTDKNFYGWSGADWKRDGGWFSSDSKGTKYELVNASTEAFFEKLYGATAKGFIDLGKSLGDTSVEELLKGFSTTINARSEYGAFYEIAQQTSDQLSSAMAKFVMPAISDVMSRTGSSDTGQAVNVLLTEVQVVRNALALIGKTSMTGVNNSTLEHMTSVADRIVLLFGSIDNLNSEVGTYYQNFFSATEQSDKIKEGINAQLTALNLPLVETKDQFRGLVDSLNLSTLSGQDAFKALMDLAPAFAAMADAATAAAEAAAAAQAQMLQVRQGWQNKLDVLTGATTERSLQLQADLASTTDATTQALIRQVYAQEDLNAAAEAAAQQAAAIAAERSGLETALLQAQGDTAALRLRELNGLDASNRALQEQIYALTDLAQAAQAAAVVAQQRLGLETQLLQLQGNTAELRARELAALDESNRALQKQIWSIQDAAEAARLAAAAAEEQARAEEAARQAAEQAAQQAAQAAAAIANERLGLQKQLWQLEGNTVALRAAELEALDASNRALQEQIWALEDQAAAAQKAAQIESERLGLQKQLWQLQGNTNALRAAELAALDPANRALQAQIWALQDSQAAAAEWKQTWDSVTASLLSQAKKIRGEIGGTQSASSLQAQFVTSTAAARAGDAGAAGNLVGLSGDLLTAFRGQAGSQLEMQRMQAWVATSLEETASLIAPPASADAQAAGELRSLRADQQAQAEAMTRLLARMDKVYARWDRDGLPATRIED